MEPPSVVGMSVQSSLGGLGLVADKSICPVWGQLTDHAPDSQPSWFYQWDEVVLDDDGEWKKRTASEYVDSAYGSTISANELLVHPAVEVNGMSANVGDVVRLIPTRVVSDGSVRDAYGNPVSHRAWLFSSTQGLRPFQLTADLIPAGGPELDKSIAAEWLDTPGTAVTLYPSHPIGCAEAAGKEWAQFISLGVGRGPGQHFRGTYGWAQWQPQAIEDDYGDWQGRWQIVTLYADLIQQAVIYTRIEPGEIGEAKLMWFDKNQFKHKIINSGYEIKVYNDHVVPLEVGMLCKVYFTRPHYIWVPLDVPDVPLYAKIGTAWVNTKGGSIGNEAVDATPCDYRGNLLAQDDVTLTTERKPTHDTAMFPGSIVRYKILPDGTKIIVSDIWDDPIGTVKWESVDPANVRQGWRLCNGANGAPDLSGRFIMSIDNADKAGDGSESTMGNELDGEFPAAPYLGRQLHAPTAGCVDGIGTPPPAANYKAWGSLPANTPAVDSAGDTNDLGWAEVLTSRTTPVLEEIFDIRPRARIMAAIERYK